MRTTTVATKVVVLPSATMRVRLAGVRPAPIIQAQARQYTCTPFRSYPTAIARAERAADLKKHPEAALTQQKLDDKKGNRHWSEENATLSEADVSLPLLLPSELCCVHPWSFLGVTAGNPRLQFQRKTLITNDALLTLQIRADHEAEAEKAAKSEKKNEKGAQ